MIRKISNLAGLVLLAATLTQVADAAPGGGRAFQLKVATFNVRFDFESDGSRRWANRVDLVVECLKEAKVNVVAFQEDMPQQVADLKAKMPNFEFVGRGRNENGSGECCSIAFETKTWSLVETGDFWLSDTPEKPGSNTWGSRYPHKVTWVVLEGKDKKRVLVLSTHFDEKPGSDGDGVRAKAATVIRQWLAKNQAKAANVVMCGDFNSAVEDESHKVMTAPNPGPALLDVFDVIKPAEPWPGTCHEFKGRPGKKRIDWILASSVMTAKSIKIDRWTKDGNFPSDHYPVVAELDLSAEKGKKK